MSLIRSAVNCRSNWANDKSPLSVNGPIELEVLNAWVTETKEQPNYQFGEVSQKSGQVINLVDHNHIDPACVYVCQQSLTGRALQRAACDGAILTSITGQLPAFVLLAFDLGGRRFILGVKRIEIPIETFF